VYEVMSSEETTRTVTGAHVRFFSIMSLPTWLGLGLGLG
jgi:hypothetical protein